MKKIWLLLLLNVVGVNSTYSALIEESDYTVAGDEVVRVLPITEELSLGELECLEAADDVLIPSDILITEKPSRLSEWSQRMAIKVLFFVDDAQTLIRKKYHVLSKALTKWRKKIL